jgi:hypothetical protein
VHPRIIIIFTNLPFFWKKSLNGSILL